MSGDLLNQTLTPLALALMMVGMGLSLRPVDFQRVFDSPTALLLGVFCQIIGLPSLGFAVTQIFALTPEYATGVMILVVCAGGVVSGLITQMAKGNVALSISMTATSMVFGVVTIPALVNLSMDYFLAADAPALPMLATSMRLIAMTLVPVAVGMIIAKHYPQVAQVWAPKVAHVSNLLLAVIIVAVVFGNLSQLLIQLKHLLPALAVLNCAAMVLGYGAGKLFGFSPKIQITLAIEVGIQNSATAIYIASSLLASQIIATPAIVYSGIAFINIALVLLAIKLWQRFSPLTWKLPHEA